MLACALNVLWRITLFKLVFIYAVGCVKCLRVFRGALQCLTEFDGVLMCYYVIVLYVLRCFYVFKGVWRCLKC